MSPQGRLILVRPALLADAAAMACVHVATWRSTYAGIVPAAYLAGLSEARCAAGWEAAITDLQRQVHAFVAEDPQAGIVGIVSCGPPQEPLAGFDGEVYSLYVLAAFQGQGLGRRLVAVAVSDLLARGCRALVIWVLKANPACRFYERLGGRPSHQKTVEVGGETLVDVGYTWLEPAMLLQEGG